MGGNADANEFIIIATRTLCSLIVFLTMHLINVSPKSDGDDWIIRFIVSKRDRTIIFIRLYLLDNF